MLAQKIDEYCEFTYDNKVIVGASEKKKQKVLEQQKPKAIVRAHTNTYLNVKLRRKLLGAVLLMLFMVVVMAVQNKFVVDRSYEIVKIKSEINKIQKENEATKLDISKLNAPQRIEQIAVNQLGMTNPKAIYYVKNDLVSSANNTTKNSESAESKSAGIAQAAERKGKSLQ